jgi:hypothetical protein
MDMIGCSKEMKPESEDRNNGEEREVERERKKERMTQIDPKETNEQQGTSLRGDRAQGAWS